MPTNPPRLISRTEKVKRKAEPFLPITSLGLFAIGTFVVTIGYDVAGLAIAAGGGFLLAKVTR